MERTRTAFGAAMLVVMFTGCGGQSTNSVLNVQSPTEAVPAPVKETIATQTEEIEVPVSTIAGYDSYVAAVDRYSDCLSREGYHIDVITDPLNPLLLFWTTPMAAVESGAEGVCYSEHLEAVDIAWQRVATAGQTGGP